MAENKRKSMDAERTERSKKLVEELRNVIDMTDRDTDRTARDHLRHAYERLAGHSYEEPNG